MNVPFRTFLLLGMAVGMLGAGYLFAPQPGAMTLPTVPPAQPAPVAAAPKPASALVASRPPVPLVTRTHGTYFVAKEEPKPAETDAAAGNARTTQVATAAVSPGTPADDAAPTVTVLKGQDDSKAKAAIELDGYKNVRALEQGPDGVWRGRAMRGRTEIAIRVDAGGSVSAE
jgi:hypothetical protein